VSTLLSARGVQVAYGSRLVVKGVSLEVRAGELWVVLGPNGAGKSSLLKACLGLLPLAGGQVDLLGQPLGAWGRRDLAQKVAWVPQDAEFDGGFSALDVVLMGRSPHQRGLALASESEVGLAHTVLGELGIQSLASRSTAELSGGEQRMVLLGRALVQEPELLFLDEPTAFLDLRHQVEVLQRVRARVKRGLGAVAVLHDVNLAAAFADRVLLLADGEQRGQGEPQVLLSEESLEALYGVSMSVAQAANGQWLYAPRLSR
jgi:iron complex transport system ATP-binding protein